MPENAKVVGENIESAKVMGMPLEIAVSYQNDLSKKWRFRNTTVQMPCNYLGYHLSCYLVRFRLMQRHIQIYTCCKASFQQSLNKRLLSGLLTSKQVKQCYRKSARVFKIRSMAVFLEFAQHLDSSFVFPVYSRGQYS